MSFHILYYEYNEGDLHFVVKIFFCMFGGLQSASFVDSKPDVATAL